MASQYKKRNPKDGRSSRPEDFSAVSRRTYTSSSSSSNASLSDVESQAKWALDLLEPRLPRQKGRDCDDIVRSYHPFAFLESEEQRKIVKSGHPEELTFVQHLTGLSAMALDQADKTSDVHGILSHISQILHDYAYMNWASVRGFSNTFLCNIAKKKWSWHDNKFIDRCRQNHYMRTRANEEPAWSVPCPRKNHGRCDEQNTHTVGEVTMWHVCSHCSKNGFENPHTLRA